MASSSIYFDHNATSPLRPEAQEAMIEAMGPPLNASSIHGQGRKARALVEQARGQIATALGARHADLTFTSGATESNNIILAGYDHIITSTVEHSAILAPRPDGIRVAVDHDGVILLDELEAVLARLDDANRANTLVSIIGANNETGVLQPLTEIGQLCRAYHVDFHSDMVQMAGKMPIAMSDDLAAKGLTFASFSAHKVGGPAGIGALWIAPGKTVPALMSGGGQEQGRRPGTENVLGIIGFGAAMQAAEAGLSEADSLAEWRNEAEALLLAQRDDITVLGAKAPRLPNTSSIALGNLTSQTALMALDLKGFCLSSGSACSSGKVKSSHVIEAMGHSHLAGHVLRISSGWTTQKEEWQKLVKTLVTL